MLFINILLCLTAFIGAFVAIGGKTWDSTKPIWRDRVQPRGWVAIGCLSTSLVLGVTKEVITAKRHREQLRNQEATFQAATEEREKNYTLLERTAYSFASITIDFEVLVPLDYSDDLVVCRERLAEGVTEFAKATRKDLFPHMSVARIEYGSLVQVRITPGSDYLPKSGDSASNLFSGGVAIDIHKDHIDPEEFSFALSSPYKGSDLFVKVLDFGLAFRADLHKIGKLEHMVGQSRLSLLCDVNDTSKVVLSGQGFKIPRPEWTSRSGTVPVSSLVDLVEAQVILRYSGTSFPADPGNYEEIVEGRSLRIQATKKAELRSVVLRLGDKYELRFSGANWTRHTNSFDLEGYEGMPFYMVTLPEDLESLLALAR